MYSDWASGLIERRFRHLVPHAKRARLFRIARDEEGPRPLSEVASRWDPDERVVQNCRLPFDSIVIEASDHREDSGGACLFLWNIDAEERHFGFFLATGNPKGQNPALAFEGSLRAFPGGELFGRMEDEQGGWTGDQAFAVISEVRDVRAYRVRGYDLDPIATGPLVDVFCKLQLRYRQGDGLEPLVEVMGDPKVARDVIEMVGDPDFFAKLDHIHTENVAEVTRMAEKVRESSPEAYAAVRVAMEEKLTKLNHRLDQYAAKMGLVVLNIHMLYLVSITEPSRFVVEERLVKEPRRNPRLELPRSPWRPHFIVLEPKKIRERLIKLSNDPSPPEQSTRAPHERRGHYRRLTSDRYSEEKRGSVIWIKPHWVGPRTAEIGNNRYEVRLDL